MAGRNERGRSNRFAVDLFRPLPHRYDLAAEVLSFRQNARWRGRMIDRIVEARPALTCDVATGTGGVALQLVSRNKGRVVAVDLSEEMVRRGRVNTALEGASASVVFVLGTAERLPFADSSFDALTFTYLFRYVPDPSETLRELVRVVKPGGRIAALEFGVPSRVLWRSLWWFYTRGVLPLAGLLVGTGWFRVGRFLGPSISEHWKRFPIEVQQDQWRSAGVERFGYEVMSLGGGVVMWGNKSAG
jgi:demethylmenaquinone methyltransferase / 2-methoxy-6-polyprenyl-1,4-benzoquinol methylase